MSKICSLLRQGSNAEGLSDYFSELEKTAKDYDEFPQTGCTALDVSIAEIRNAFRAQSVVFTYSVDGKLLGRMDETDIYSLFGNILRNAFNSTAKEAEVEKRSVSLLICEKARQIYIHEDNYCSVDVQFENGMPQTTGDRRFHGFGTKSIAYTVNKYKGTVLFSQREDRFCVDILIPLAE